MVVPLCSVHTSSLSAESHLLHGRAVSVLALVLPVRADAAAATLLHQPFLFPRVPMMPLPPNSLVLLKHVGFVHSFCLPVPKLPVRACDCSHTLYTALGDVVFR
jgi:hypothetical protein